MDVERRKIDDNGIITASVPTSDFLRSQSYQTYYSTPQRRTTVSPRVDLAAELEQHFELPVRVS